MNAIRLHTANGPAGLVYEQIETPQPKEGEVLVRVHAAAITRDELDWPVDRLPAIPVIRILRSGRGESEAMLKRSRLETRSMP